MKNKYDNTREHNDLMDELELEFSRPNVKIWPRVVGFDYTRKIHYGRKGETDLEGIIAPYGRLLGIEVKTGTGKLSPGQIKWKRLIISHGGLYIEARSLKQAIIEYEAEMQIFIKKFINKKN